MTSENNLNSNDRLTELAKSKGINSWENLIQFVKNLPYGRNENRYDFGLVLTELKGTCSSKHALLKSIADSNKIPNVELIIGIYKMNEINTPKIADELSKYSISYLPEAHCYLSIENEKIDLTNHNSDFKKIENDILIEKTIEPEKVTNYKIEYHKKFLKNWIQTVDLKYDFEEVWQIRENCIKKLAE